VGQKFYIFDSSGNVVMYSKMKAFKLKEDIRVYSGEDMLEELLLIHARNVIDFSAVYDVIDPKTGEKVGAIKRKGLKSIMKDEWIIMDQNDTVIGVIKEDSLGFALLRRFLTNLVPQKYNIEMNNMAICQFKQNFNPFVVKLNLDFSTDTNHLLDKRLGIAAGILLCAIEGKQG
jgi:ribosomal silencing factor RsfS